MHHAGLPQHRYGTLPAVPRRQDEHTQKFIREREPFYKELMAKVETMKEYEGVSSSDYLWFNYRMMQVFDRLSLVFLLQLRPRKSDRVRVAVARR